MSNYREDRPGRTHEELVATFRAAIKERKDPSISPEEILRHELVNQRHSSSIGDERAKFLSASKKRGRYSSAIDCQPDQL